MKQGHVAGIDARWIGSAAGTDVVETQVRWTVAADIEPAWDVAMAYLIEVRGAPQINLRVDVLPEDLTTFTLEDVAAMGSMITAMPVVNAIAAVVSARPGIVTYADLPTVASRLAVKR